MAFNFKIRHKIGGLDEILVSWRKTKNSLSSSVTKID